MQKVKNFKITINLTPVQLIWLHSHRLFMKIEQNTRDGVSQIQFYKTNTGVEIRFEPIDEQPDWQVASNAKQEVEKLISTKTIKLLDASLVKEVYARVGREARRQFPNTYILFLHYETFENCCKKLGEKFGLTAPMKQFERLRQENNHFCFLISDSATFPQVERYTQKLFNMEISCASTSISNGVRRVSLESDGLSLSKRAHSVTSLRGSFTSGQNDTHTEPEQRLSVNNSQAGEEIYEIGQAVLVNLQKQQLNQIVRTKKYNGSAIAVEFCQGSYLDIKKRLYYANRLQTFPNPYIQQVFAYGVGHNLNTWWAYFIISPTAQRLQEAATRSCWQPSVQKVRLIREICKATQYLHRNRETHGELSPTNIRFDWEKRVLLSGTPVKNIPPHTNPFDYDLRLLLLLIYWIMTGIELSYEALLKKNQMNRPLFSMLEKVKQPLLLSFYQLTNQLMSQSLSLKNYIAKLGRLTENSN